MLTQRQINKIEKSMKNGTGSDIKISRTQIRRSVKHGGNLFTSLTSLGTKLLPFAMRGVSKVAPALATGAASALGETGLKKTIWSRNGYAKYHNSKKVFPNVTTSCKRAYTSSNKSNQQSL